MEYKGYNIETHSFYNYGWEAYKEGNIEECLIEAETIEGVISEIDKR